MAQLIQFRFLSGLFIFLGASLFFISIIERGKSNNELWVVLSLSGNNGISEFYPDLPKVHDQVNFYSLVGQGRNFYMAASKKEFQQLSQISRSVCNLSRSIAQVQIYYCAVEVKTEKENPLIKRVFDN